MSVEIMKNCREQFNPRLLNERFNDGLYNGVRQTTNWQVATFNFRRVESP